MAFIFCQNSCYISVLVACSNLGSNSIKYRQIQNARTLNVITAKPKNFVVKCREVYYMEWNCFYSLVNLDALLSVLSV